MKWLAIATWLAAVFALWSASLQLASCLVPLSPDGWGILACAFSAGVITTAGIWSWGQKTNG